MTDYKETLNLPQTGLPMRANLAQREPRMLAHWQELDIYGQGGGQPTGWEVYTLTDTDTLLVGSGTVSGVFGPNPMSHFDIAGPAAGPHGGSVSLRIVGTGATATIWIFLRKSNRQAVSCEID